MCVEYRIAGKTVSTQGELMEIFPQEKIVMFDENKHFYPKDCLCPVDAWKTAEANNMKVISTAMYFHFGEDEINKAKEWEKKYNGWWTEMIDGKAVVKNYPE